MSAGRRRLGFGAMAAALLVMAVPVRAENAQEAVKSAVGSDQIQHDRPLAERARESVGEIRDQPDLQHDPPARQAEAAPPAAPGLSMDLSWLPYVILGAIGIALVYLLAQYLRNRFAARGSAAAKASPLVAQSSAVPAPEPARDRTFDEVDALAEAGAFAEAVHRLLLLVQERLRGRVEHGLQVSLTSREILRRARLSPEGSTAFATLVAAVEVSLFGMRAADAATYAQCRENSRRVLAAAAE
jgi:hypothetical protein